MGGTAEVLPQHKGAAVIVETCEQGSPEWRALHVGIPSAGSFHKIITPAGKPSASRDKYLAEKVAEYFYGDTLDPEIGGVGQQWMERGKELEPDARAVYAFRHNVEVQQVGMILRDDRMVGCSPDGRIPTLKKGVEFKNYELVHHVSAALKTDNAHYVQVQGGLWLSGDETWDRVYHHPRFPATEFTFERDEEFIAKLAEAVDLFIADMLAARAYLESQGWTPIRLTKCPATGIDQRVCRCPDCVAKRESTKGE